MFLASVALLAASAMPVRVAVVDTGLDLQDPRFKKHLCKTGHKDFTGEGIYDKEGHGTHVTGLIQEYAKDAKYCLIIIKFYGKSLGSKNHGTFIQAIQYAESLNVDYINVSGGGNDASKEEKEAIASHPNTLVIAAAGNDGKDLSDPEYAGFYPACYPYKNVIVVGALNEKNERANFSNYGTRVDIWKRGTNINSTWPGGYTAFESGTSQATAIYTGELIYVHAHQSR